MALTFAPITNRLDGQLHMLVCNDHGEWEADGQRPLSGGRGQVGYAWGRDPRYLIQRDLYYQNSTFSSVTTRIFASAWGPAIMGKQLGDLDHALVAFFINKTLADTVSSITVMANEYIIWKTRSVLEIEESEPKDVTFPLQFTPTELQDRWVQLKGDLTSGWFDFSRFTPRRLFAAEEIGGGF